MSERLQNGILVIICSVTLMLHVLPLFEIWASSWDCGTYHIGDLRRLRRACAPAQSRQSLRCLHIWSVEVNEGSDQKSDIKSHWIAAHARLKNEFTEDERCRNLMSRLIWFMGTCLLCGVVVVFYAKDALSIWYNQMRMSRLVWAFAVRLCDKYHNLVSWLKWHAKQRNLLALHIKHSTAPKLGGALLVLISVYT